MQKTRITLPNGSMIEAFSNNPNTIRGLMRKVAEQQSVETVSKISKTLLDLGFEMQLLGSECYVKAKLESLSPVQLVLIREALLRIRIRVLKKSLLQVSTNRLTKPLTISRA